LANDAENGIESPKEDYLGKIHLQVKSDCSVPKIWLGDPEGASAFSGQARENSWTRWGMDFVSRLTGGASNAFLGLGKLFADQLSNSNISTSRTAIYFGEVSIYSSAMEYFTINNYGDCQVTVSMNYPNGFSMNPTMTTIEPQGSSSIAVTFSPSVAQSYSGYVSGDHGISVYLQGTGKDPNSHK
jgi:hypothetical protein